jgi:hypothetical protein
MTKLVVNDDGVRDPYTKAVERFLELLDEAFPESDEKATVCRLIRACSNDVGLYQKQEKLDTLLAEAVSSARNVAVPARDRVTLANHYHDCLRYSDAITPQLESAQRVVTEAYSEAFADERALLASLAAARDDLYESPKSKQSLKSFDSAVLLIVNQRRLLKRATNLFSAFSVADGHFSHPSVNSR